MRECHFSLEYRAIRPSKVFGTRRKDALRGETYAWAPDLRSFDKLQEVEVSPYLGFIIYLSTLLMFELTEAVRGRLIGPKSWDRIVRPEKFQFLEKWQNRNFGYEIVISVKNP